MQTILHIIGRRRVDVDRNAVKQILVAGVVGNLHTDTLYMNEAERGKIIGRETPIEGIVGMCADEDIVRLKACDNEGMIVIPVLCRKLYKVP